MTVADDEERDQLGVLDMAMTLDKIVVALDRAMFWLRAIWIVLMVILCVLIYRTVIA